MTHIVAVSGYNVTIIAEYLVFLAAGSECLEESHMVRFCRNNFIRDHDWISGVRGARRRNGSGTLLWAMKNGRLASSGNAIIFAGAVMLFY